MRKYLAEMIGTMVLVLMGCGSAVFAGNAADALGTGVGTIGVALAFGLSVVAMAYTRSCLGFWLVGSGYGLYHRECFGMPYQSGYHFGGMDVGTYDEPCCADVYGFSGYRRYYRFVDFGIADFYRRTWRTDYIGC